MVKYFWHQVSRLIQMFPSSCLSHVWCRDSEDNSRGLGEEKEYTTHSSNEGRVLSDSWRDGKRPGVSYLSLLLYSLYILIVLEGKINGQRKRYVWDVRVKVKGKYQ